MSTKEQPSKPNRRKMMIASSAALAAATVASPLQADRGKNRTEIDRWESLIGESFSFGRTGISMELVEVRRCTFEDPNRPREFRSPFSLFFKPPTKSKPLPDGTYLLVNRLSGRHRLFAVSTLVSDLSRFPVYEIALG